MAMAENDRGDTASSKEGEAWGTLEELLLACAVSRHGANSWDSIAMEVQNRTSQMNSNNNNSKFLNDFTPHNCRQRYHTLKRRFDVTGKANELRENIPFIVDELRKIRVEELRREVERHDVSIVSLELKVKRLEEERERTSVKAATASGDADLRTGEDRSDAAVDERRSGEPDRSSAEVADKSISSGRSDEPEDRSFNESNSTSHKGKETNRRREPDENRSDEPDPVGPVVDSEPDKDSSSTRGGDCHGLEEGKVVGRTSQPVRLGSSGDLRESVSESKREAAGEVKQSSDVQSSASLSRRKGGGVGSSGDEMEAEELSPANKRMDVKSQPLIKFLGILRSHEHGLVFQRRLPSQGPEEYSNVVRQHMDLEMVQSKLDGGSYCDCQSKFYRDILLVFTNAALFFRKTSTEHVAAHELRKMVTKEILAQQLAQKPNTAQLVKPVCKEIVAQKPKPAQLFKPVTDLESQILDPVVKKPRTATNIVVCRRRTNPNAIKPSTLSSEPNTPKSKEEGVENADHHKDEPKKLKKEVPNLIGRSLVKAATSNNNGGSGDKKKKGMVQGESNNSNNASASNNNTGKKDESSDGEEEQPINKRRRLLQPSLKKKGVVNFLKRMKQNSPSKEVVDGIDDAKEEQEEKATKKTEISKKKVVVGKKKDDDDGAGKDDNATQRRISGRRSTREGEETGRSGNTRRGGGRPPTRKAAMGGTPDSGRVKRQKDGDKEVVGASGRVTAAKKKSRR